VLFVALAARWAHWLAGEMVESRPTMMLLVETMTRRRVVGTRAPLPLPIHGPIRWVSAACYPAPARRRRKHARKLIYLLQRLQAALQDLIAPALSARMRDEGRVSDFVIPGQI